MEFVVPALASAQLHDTPRSRPLMTADYVAFADCAEESDSQLTLIRRFGLSICSNTLSA